jgi:hypothetical protein
LHFIFILLLPLLTNENIFFIIGKNYREEQHPLEEFFQAKNIRTKNEMVDDVSGTSKHTHTPPPPPLLSLFLSFSVFFGKERERAFPFFFLPILPCDIYLR